LPKSPAGGCGFGASVQVDAPPGSPLSLMHVKPAAVCARKLAENLAT